jgi:hypothetical protein
MKRILQVAALLIVAVILVTASPIWFADATVKQVIGTQTYIGLSTDTKPSSPDEGSTFYETNTGRSWIYTGSAWTLKILTAQQDTTRLTAPGNFSAIGVNGYSQAAFTVKVTSINTSVTVRFCGKINNGFDWFSLDAENDSLVVTANSTVGRVFNFVGVLDSLRVQFLSEAGGTAAVVTAGIKLGNPYK